MLESQKTHHLVLRTDDEEFGLVVSGYREPDITPFAPKIASGNLSYSDQTIYNTLVQDDFSHGFGYRNMTEPRAYAYTRGGVDSRNQRLLMMSTKMVETFPEQVSANNGGFEEEFDTDAYNWYTMGDVDGNAGVRSAVDPRTDVYHLSLLGGQGGMNTGFTQQQMDISEDMWGVTIKVELYAKGVSGSFMWSARNSSAVELDTDTEALTVNAGYVFNRFFIVVPTNTAYILFTLLSTASVLVDDFSVCSIPDTGAKKFIEYDGKVYCGTYNGVYEFNDTTGAWQTCGLNDGEVNDMLNDGHNLFVTLSGERGQYYDGIVWAYIGDANFTDMNLMIVSNGYAWATDATIPWIHYSSEPIIDWEGGILPAGDPDPVRVGATEYPIRSMVGWHNSVYMGKEDGLFYHPPAVEVAYTAIDFQNERHLFNFQSMAVWQGQLFFMIRNTLFRYTGTTVLEVTPRVFGYDFPYDQYGDFKFLCTSGPYLFAIAGYSLGDGGAGDLPAGVGPAGGVPRMYSLLCYDGVAWHNIHDMTEGGTIHGMGYTPNNDKLWLSFLNYDGSISIKYIPFRTDSNMPFPLYDTTATNNNDLFTSTFDAELSTIHKHFSSLRLMGMVSDIAYIDVSYSLDSGSWIALGRFDASSGEQLLEFDQSNFSLCVGKSIRFRLRFLTENENITPVLERLVLHYLPRPDTIYSFTFNALLADNIKRLDHLVDRCITSYDLYQYLRRVRASKKPIELEDIWGNKRIVYMSALEWVPTRFEYGDTETPMELEGYIRTTLVVATAEGG